MGKETKIKIYESVLVPILIYSYEPRVQQTEACGMKVLWKNERITRINKVKRKIIRNSLKVRSVFKRLEDQQLRWFRYVFRMGEERVA